jgi:hypothetical protein
VSLHLADRLAALTLAVAALVAALTVGDYGIGADEWNTVRYGEQSLRWYLTLGADTSSFDYYDLHYYGAALHALIAALGHLVAGPRAVYLVRHAAGMALGILGLAGTWRLGRRVGGPWAGLAALLVLALTPYYWGQMAALPEDTPLAAAMTWALLAMLAYVERLPRPSVPAALHLAVACGAAAAVRVGAIPILVLEFAGALLIYGAAHRHDWRSILVRLAWQGPAILVVVWALTVLAWPWGLVDPIARPIETLTHFRKLPIDFEFPFWGEPVRTTHLPWTYVPGYLLAKLPLIFLAGLVLVPVAIWLDRNAERDRRPLVLAIVAAVLPVVIAVASHATLYDGVRHFLFIFPPLAALAGCALVRLAQVHRVAETLVGAAAAVSAVLLLRANVDLHPYEYIWFNALAGGVRGTVETFEQEYWATAETELVHRLLAKLGPDAAAPHRYKLCVWWNDIAPLLPSNWIKTENDDPTDFIIAVERFPCAPDDGHSIVRVERDGVALGWVSDKWPR